MNQGLVNFSGTAKNTDKVLNYEIQLCKNCMDFQNCEILGTANTFGAAMNHGIVNSLNIAMIRHVTETNFETKKKVQSLIPFDSVKLHQDERPASRTLSPEPLLALLLFTERSLSHLQRLKDTRISQGFLDSSYRMSNYQFRILNLNSIKASFNTVHGISQLHIHQFCFILSPQHYIQSKTQQNRTLFLSTTQRFSGNSRNHEDSIKRSFTRPPFLLHSCKQFGEILVLGIICDRSDKIGWVELFTN